MTDRNDAETMYPNQKGGWSIELRYKSIAHRGHAFLALVNDRGKVERELHGLAHSRNPGKEEQGTGEAVKMGMDGSELFVADDAGQRMGGKVIATVASGSPEELQRIWSRGAGARAAINARNFDYKSHDPSYELGTDGGQIQNSNSVAFTLGKVMGLDLDRVLREKGMTRTFSGWGRDLLDPKYERYVAPPTFPVRDAP